jgi:hypothetical protein
MRRFIATMQMSIDAKIEGPEGYADWVDAWSDVAGVVPEVTVHPLVAGPGKALFETIGRRHRLELRRNEALSGGRVGLTYEMQPR